MYCRNIKNIKRICFTLNNSPFTMLNCLSIRHMSSANICAKATGLQVIDPCIGLTPEQTELYQLAKEFANNELLPNAQKWDRECIFPFDAFKKLAEIGFTGMYVSPEYGGTGLPKRDSLAIVEALSTGCVGTTTMFTIHAGLTSVIERFGTEEQKRNWIQRLIDVDAYVSFCLTEPGSGSDAASLQTKAIYDDSKKEYVINGSKSFISGAGKHFELIKCFPQ